MLQTTSLQIEKDSVLRSYFYPPEVKNLHHQVYPIYKKMGVMKMTPIIMQENNSI